MRSKRSTFIILSLLFISLFVIAAKCETSTQQGGLTFKDAYLSSQPLQNNQPPEPAKTNSFTSGERIYFYFRQVGPFTKNAEGKQSFDMSYQILSEEGEPIFGEENLYADTPPLTVPGDHLYVYTSFQAPAGTTGNFQASGVVYDKVSGAKVTKTITFTLV
ncbi:MAG: hypothetical protein WC595_03425 [Candidatus Nanoarchaeia archaeon]